MKLNLSSIIDDLPNITSLLKRIEKRIYGLLFFMIFIVAGTGLISYFGIISTIQANVNCPIPNNPIGNTVTISSDEEVIINSSDLQKDPQNPSKTADCTGLDIVIEGPDAENENSIGGRLILESEFNDNDDLSGDFGITLLADNIEIRDGGSIIADGKGYVSDANESEGDGSTPNATSSGGTGAGHASNGGIAVTSNDETVNEGGSSYGVNSDGNLPYTLGAAGGDAVNGAIGGAGGGAIKIEVNEEIIINGLISSNGLDGEVDTNMSGGGGAGGSIIILADIFDGSGMVQANGGGTEASQFAGGGGSGGYIFMVCNSADGYSGEVEAAGGQSSGPGSQGGGEGSIIGPTCRPENPVTSSMFQYTSEPADISLAVGEIYYEDVINFSIGAIDASNDIEFVEFEIMPTSTPFSDEPTDVYVSSGGASKPCSSPISDCANVEVELDREESYHWQARVVDVFGVKSSWMSFGDNDDGETDIQITGVPDSVELVSGNNQENTVFTRITEPMVVRVITSDGFPIPNYPIRWRVSDNKIGGPNPTGGELLENTNNDLLNETTITDTQGQAEISYRLGEIVGQNSIIASNEDLVSIKNVSFTQIGVHDVLNEIAFDISPVTKIDDPFDKFIVTLLDRYGNVNTTYDGTITIKDVIPNDNVTDGSGDLNTNQIVFVPEDNGVKNLNNQISYDEQANIKIEFTGINQAGSNILTLSNILLVGGGQCPVPPDPLDPTIAIARVNDTWDAALLADGSDRPNNTFDCTVYEEVIIEEGVNITITNDERDDDSQRRAILEVNNLTLRANATLDLTAQGFKPGETGTVPATPGGTGGSHGGYGEGAYSGINLTLEENDIREIPYGDFRDPVFPGRAGGASICGTGGPGNGGGALLINASDSLNLGGSILANGIHGEGEGRDFDNSCAYGGAGGAGGSINIKADIINKIDGTTPLIQADGGSSSGFFRGSTGDQGKASGGGGRISLKTRTSSSFFDDPDVNIEAGRALAPVRNASNNDFGESLGNGGAGTIYYENGPSFYEQNNGVLIVDNKNFTNLNDAQEPETINRASITDSGGEVYNLSEIRLLNKAKLELTNPSSTIVVDDIENDIVTDSDPGDTDQTDVRTDLAIYGTLDARNDNYFEDLNIIIEKPGRLITDESVSFSNSSVYWRGEWNFNTNDTINNLELLQNARLDIATDTLSSNEKIIDIDNFTINDTSRANVVNYDYKKHNEDSTRWINDIVKFTTNNLTVASQAELRSDGQGFQSEAENGSSGAFGGYNSDGTGTPYGDFRFPENLGNQGGGGIIHFTASNNILLDGVVSANGLADGTGGSIFLESPSFSGTEPQIMANGSGTGSGGRIALYARNNDPIFFEEVTNNDTTTVERIESTTITAFGPGNAGSGTIYYEGPYLGSEGILLTDDNEGEINNNRASIVTPGETLQIARIDLNNYADLELTSDDATVILQASDAIRGDGTSEFAMFGDVVATSPEFENIEGVGFIIEDGGTLETPYLTNITPDFTDIEGINQIGDPNLKLELRKGGTLISSNDLTIDKMQFNWSGILNSLSDPADPNALSVRAGLTLKNGADMNLNTNSNPVENNGRYELLNLSTINPDINNTSNIFFNAINRDAKPINDDQNDIGEAPKLYIENNFNLNEFGYLNADGLGYLKSNNDRSGGSGPGNSGSAIGGNCGDAYGASHGGFNLRRSDSYGDFMIPTSLGSGGTRAKPGFFGRGCRAPGGDGGGAIYIEVGNNFNVDGTISANGLDGTASGQYPYGTSSGGAGAGGSIYLKANSFTKTQGITPVIRANGGASAESLTAISNAAGGRIAIYANSTDEVFFEEINNPNGSFIVRINSTVLSTYGPGNAGAGTIFYKGDYSENADGILFTEDQVGPGGEGTIDNQRSGIIFPESIEEPEITQLNLLGETKSFRTLNLSKIEATGWADIEISQDDVLFDTDSKEALRGDGTAEIALFGTIRSSSEDFEQIEGLGFIIEATGALISPYTSSITPDFTDIDGSENVGEPSLRLELKKDSNFYTLSDLTIDKMTFNWLGNLNSLSNPSDLSSDILNTSITLQNGADMSLYADSNPIEENGTYQLSNLSTTNPEVSENSFISFFPSENVIEIDDNPVDQSPRLNIERNLNLNRFGYITADDLGYRSENCTDGYGSSHGGYNTTNNRPYGSYKDPVSLGCASSGRGGGSIYITVEEEFLLDGIISANGGSTANGSGGSIYISSGSFDKSSDSNPIIRSNGSGGGSGGRIAIYADEIDNVFYELRENEIQRINDTTLSAFGPGDAAAGTVYYEGPDDYYDDTSKKGILLSDDNEGSLNNRRSSIIETEGIIELERLELRNYADIELTESDSTLKIDSRNSLVGDGTAEIALYGSLEALSQDFSDLNGIGLVIEGGGLAQLPHLEYISSDEIASDGSVNLGESQLRLQINKNGTLVSSASLAVDKMQFNWKGIINSLSDPTNLDSEITRTEINLLNGSDLNLYADSNSMESEGEYQLSNLVTSNPDIQGNLENPKDYLNSQNNRNSYIFFNSINRQVRPLNAEDINNIGKGPKINVENNLVLNEYGLLFADGFGYLRGQSSRDAGYGPGNSGGSIGGNCGDGYGAAFGGYNVQGQRTAVPYGDLFNPISLGSGGTTSTEGFFGIGCSASGGNGGGAINVEIDGTFTLEGIITAKGQDGSTNSGNGGKGFANGGAGSGGSILINANRLEISNDSSALITADGGSSPGEFSRGSGGRIAIYSESTNENFENINLSAKAGGDNSGPGTIFISINENITKGIGDLIIDNGKFINGRAQNFEGVNYSFDDVEIGNSIEINLDSDLENNQGTVFELDGNFSLGNNSEINARGKGFVAEEGPGAGGRASGASGGGGGGHGGIGGRGEQDTIDSEIGSPGGSYGNDRIPLSLGSGGGNAETGGIGGAGGGALAIIAPNGDITLATDSEINVSGENGTTGSPGGGGGAGGSIYLNSRTCSIDSFLNANGGYGGISSDAFSGGAGSGGIISIIYSVGPCTVDETINSRLLSANFGSNAGSFTGQAQQGVYNEPYAISFVGNMQQYNYQSSNIIPHNGNITDTRVTLEVQVLDNDASASNVKRLRAEFELKEFGEEFDGNQVLESEIIEFDGGDSTYITVDATELTPGKDYKWRSRIINVDENIFSSWAEFIPLSALPDFRISQTNELDLYPTSGNFNYRINEPIDLTVDALDDEGVLDQDYNGTISITTTASFADTPSNFTFTPGIDNGTVNFFSPDNLIFYEGGTFEVTVVDIFNPLLSDTETFNIIGPTSIPTSPDTTNITSPTTTSLPSITPTPLPPGCDEDPSQTGCSVPFEITSYRHDFLDDPSMVEICWRTNIAGKGSINYGEVIEGSALLNFSTPVTEDYALEHCQILDDIKENTNYVYRINAFSRDGSTDFVEDNFDKLAGVVSEQCISAVSEPNLRADESASISFKTSSPAVCRINYGSQTENLNETIVNSNLLTEHLGTFDLNIIEAGSDLYYEIDCTLSEENTDNSNSNKCTLSGAISYPQIDRFVPASVSTPSEDNSSFNAEIFSAILLAATSALSLLLFALAYPRWLLYAISWLVGHRENTIGIVYDEKTKKPIPFVTVRLLESGNIIKQMITDSHGKYAFPASIGEYEIKAAHPNYMDASVNVELEHEGLAAAEISMSEEDENIINKRNSLRKNLYLLNNLIFFTGLVVSIIITFFFPHPFNFFVIFTYIAQIIIIYLIHRRRSWGIVVESTHYDHLSGAFVRLFNKNQFHQIDVAISDDKGRYYFNVNKGEYLISADKSGYIFPSKETSQSKVMTSDSGNKFIEYNNSKNSDVLDTTITLDKDQNRNNTPAQFGS